MSGTDETKVWQAVARACGSYGAFPDHHGICAALGIDPDMPVEQLRMRLLFGERVERCEMPTDAGWVDVCDGRDDVFFYADTLLSVLRRPPSASETSGCPAETRRDAK